jgi:hypothetical protein
VPLTSKVIEVWPYLPVKAASEVACVHVPPMMVVVVVLVVVLVQVVVVVVSPPPEVPQPLANPSEKHTHPPKIRIKII